MPAETMLANINLANILLQCTIFKDLELNDILEIAVDGCLDFVESINDYHGIEKSQGNAVTPDTEGSSKLLGILKKIQIVNKDLNERLKNLEATYGATVHQFNIDDIRINEIRFKDDFTLTDRIYYSHKDIKRNIQTDVRGGSLLFGTPVAVKIYTCNNKADLNEFIEEVENLKMFSNQKKCFLQYYGSVLHQNQLFIVTEQCERTLYEDMEKRKVTNQPYSDEERLNIMRELTEGFYFMSYKKKYHRDIKPQNIMFNSQNLVKIIDFNLTLQTEEIEPSVGGAGVYPIQGTVH